MILILIILNNSYFYDKIKEIKLKYIRKSGYNMTNQKTDKQLFNEVFRELRKKKIFAKQNFLCCQTCAWSSVPSEEENVVFYHNQDKSSFDSNGYLNSIIYLAWRGNTDVIIEAFKSKGFKVQWNGSDLNRIGILTDKILENKKDIVLY